MKVLIIDNLTQTFEGSIVRSGLQKSSKLDAQAFSKFYDTTYAYCGSIIDYKYTYTHKVLSPLGAKDLCLSKGESAKSSFKYVRVFLQDLKKELEEAEIIIAHCHSLTMLTTINELVSNKKIIFIIHDVIDLMWQSGFTGAVNALKKKPNNNYKIMTNSDYSIQRANYNYGRRKSFEKIKSGDELFDGYIKHFIWTDEKLEVREKANFFATIGRYTSDKFHHKLYNHRNFTNDYHHKTIHFGVKDPIRDKGLKYYNTLIKMADSFVENASDEELNIALQTVKAVILPCPHEGFGFTAFEAGIYGAVPVVLMQAFSGTDIKCHATNEYLNRSKTFHYTVDFNDEHELYSLMDESINTPMELRKQISNSLLSYFTLENYVNERVELF
jgi:hypothetical protein